MLRLFHSMQYQKWSNVSFKWKPSLFSLSFLDLSSIWRCSRRCWQGLLRIPGASCAFSSILGYLANMLILAIHALNIEDNVLYLCKTKARKTTCSVSVNVSNIAVMYFTVLFVQNGATRKGVFVFLLYSAYWISLESTFYGFQFFITWIRILYKTKLLSVLISSV